MSERSYPNNFSGASLFHPCLVWPLSRALVALAARPMTPLVESSQSPLDPRG